MGVPDVLWLLHANEGQGRDRDGAGSRADGIGNGRAAAVLLAREGAAVALLDAVAEWAEATRGMIAAEGGTSLVIPCDVTDEAAAAAAVRRTVEEWGRLDVLVNNVGVGGPRAARSRSTSPSGTARCA